MRTKKYASIIGGCFGLVVLSLLLMEWLILIIIGFILMAGTIFGLNAMFRFFEGL